MQVVSSSNQMLKSERTHDDLRKLSGKDTSVCMLIVLILTAICVVLVLHM